MKFLEQWRPKDCIALLVIIGAISLLFAGIDTYVGWTLVSIVAAYYGIEITPFVKLGLKKKAKGVTEDGKAV